MNIFKNKTIAWVALFFGLSQTSAMAFTLGATDFSDSNDTVEKVLLLDIDVSGSTAIAFMTNF